MSAAARAPPETARVDAPGRIARLARGAVAAPILAYQKVVSPLLPARCKYEPSCSRYATQALREYGILRGLILSGWRLLRCNPWSHGGYDPVHEQRLFSPSRPPAPSA